MRLSGWRLWLLATVAPLVQAQAHHKVGPLQAQLNGADIDNPTTFRLNLGLPPSVVIDTTNAGNITSGTLPVGRLPDLSTGSATATGGTTARTLADQAADVVNVKSGANGVAGAQGAAFVGSDGTIAAGRNAFSSASATFTAADVGKIITLGGSEANGAAQRGTITGYTDAHHVTVSFTAALATPWSSAIGGVVAMAQSGVGSYAPNDTLTVSGGTASAAQTFTVTDTQATAATVATGGTGGTGTSCTVIGTTGTAATGLTYFQATGTISGGALTGPLTISVPGDYTANPTTLTAEPVTGCGLTGATVSVAMGVLLVKPTNIGVYTALPINPVATTDSGAGTGATLTLSTIQRGGTFWYGADDGPAITAAIAKANAQNGGGHVYLPAGTYLVNLANNGVRLLSNVDVGGDVNGGTTIICDDIAGHSMQCLDSYTNGPIYTENQNITVHDLTLRGTTDINPTGSKAENLQIYDTANVDVYRVRSYYSGIFGIDVKYSMPVSVHDNTVEYSNADGIAVWSSPEATISGNHISNCPDDAISAHTTDTDPSPPRSGVVVENNTISACQGINVLGAKIVTIKGNNLRYMLGSAINFGVSPGFSQGATPNFAVTITDNVITDVIGWPNIPQRNGEQFYILIGGGPKGASGLLPTFGAANTTGALYANNTTSSINTPGGGYVDISHNILMRTLPPVSQYSQWGFSPYIWTSSSGATAPYYNGPVTEANLETPGIQINGPLRNSKVEHNLIATSASPIFLTSHTSLDYDGLRIGWNKLADIGAIGITDGGGSGYTDQQRIEIVGNEIDGDPRFVSTNRGSNGTWLANNYPFAIAFNGVSGITLTDNTFRNVANPISQGSGVWTLHNNTQYANPIGGTGFHTTNTGIGYVYPSGDDWRTITEDDNPNSGTYGQMLNTGTKSASTMPASGTWMTGTFVSNNAPNANSGSTLLGWLRVTTGSGNVLNTDWINVYSWLSGDNTNGVAANLIPANGLNGKLQFWNNGVKWYLENSGASNTLLLYDQIGGRSVFSATPQGAISVNGGTAAASTNGADIALNGQSGGAGNQNGGNIVLTAGAATGTGTPGHVIIPAIPTAAPATHCALWNNAGTLNVTTCP